MKNITINGKQLSVDDDITIIEAAKRNGLAIPSLCYLEGGPSVRLVQDLRSGSRGRQDPDALLHDEGLRRHGHPHEY